MKKKTLIIIAVCTVTLLLAGGLTFLTLKYNENRENEKEIDDENEEENEENEANLSPAEELLKIPSVEYPTLTIENNSEDLTDEELREHFEKYYPYFVYFLGTPNDFERGLTWVWDNSLTDWSVYTEKGIDNFVATTNSIYLGPLGYDDNPTANDEFEIKRQKERLAYGYMHETAHLFFQYNKVPISYDFGQWIWEAEALVGETLTRRALGDQGGDNESHYDISSLLGTMINGVTQDGLKFNRSISDSNATTALALMTDILSTEGTYDFTSKVNALKVQAAEAKRDHTLTKEEYSAVIDEAAGEKTIDGLSASEWLFSQPVSDTHGALGNYFGVETRQVVDNRLNELSVALYGFKRVSSENGRESDNYEMAFENIPVTVSLYDSSSNLIENFETTIESSGVREANFPLSEDDQISTGVYRVTAQAEYENEALSSTSFKVFLGEETPMTDDNMYFLLLNEDGTINTEAEGRVTVEGVKSTNIDYLNKGLLIVTADRGDNVTIKWGNKSAVYSKPESSRAIPVEIVE